LNAGVSNPKNKPSASPETQALTGRGAQALEWMQEHSEAAKDREHAKMEAAVQKRMTKVQKYQGCRKE